MLKLGPSLSAEISPLAMPLFFKIRGQHSDSQYFAYYLEYLTFHMPERLLVPALEWLIRNGVVEERFLDFVQNDCARSGLELVRNLTMRLERDKKPRQLFDKDIRT
jgi:hypothetical protein